MRIGIMQPYFLPYIGYFQLINAVDQFVVYDNIKYTKKGWINRNRVLMNGKDEFITLPLKKDSDYLNVVERYLAESFEKEASKTLRRLSQSYQKAPYFDQTFSLINRIYNYPDKNLFGFILYALKEICAYLEIQTEIVKSSTIPVDHDLKGEIKVLEICKALGATSYMNPIGGLELYSKDTFAIHGIDLMFLQADKIVYSQFNNDFLSSLSILDVLMFNTPEVTKRYLTQYSII